MAKTVYLTKEQYETLEKNFISEGGNNLTMPVEIEQGDNIMDKLSAAKDNISQSAGTEVANNTNFTISGSKVEGKRYSKKQIDEARLHKIMSTGKKYSKADFTKEILRNG
jgi:tyrosyl-tRNA synthetase